MMRIWILAGALAFASSPQSATAQDGAKLDCVVNGIDPETRSRIGREMQNIPQSLMDVTAPTFKYCVDKYGITGDAIETYVNYSLSRIGREWSMARLENAGVSSAVIDQTLDFGPGRKNPTFDGSQYDAFKDAFEGVFTALKLGDGTLSEDATLEIVNYVAAYMEATPDYWITRQSLRD